MATVRFAHGRAVAFLTVKLGGRISQGACAPEAGHLADSMPEAANSHDLMDSRSSLEDSVVSKLAKIHDPPGVQNERAKGSQMQSGWMQHGIKTAPWKLFGAAWPLAGPWRHLGALLQSSRAEKNIVRIGSWTA